MDNFKINLRKRGGLKQRLTNIAKFIESISDVPIPSAKQLKELELRLSTFNQLTNDFNQIQESIEILCSDDELSEQLQYRDEYTNMLMSLQAAASTILFTSTVNESPQNNSDNLNINNFCNCSSNATQVKLPTIELPKFNGDYKQWLEFKDTFTSLIHKNAQINDIQKFHYLRASLGPNALKLVQSLEFTSNNYEKAWELLCKRYNKSQLLISSHLTAVFEMDPITKESSTSLRTIIDTVSEHLLALKTLKQPTEHWDAIIIYVVAKKLDKTTARQWDHFNPSDELATLQEFLDFLISRADSLEKFEHNHYKDNKDIRVHTKRSMVASSSVSCNYCKDAHAIYQCATFLNLTPNDRLQQVIKLKLCKNCLCHGHDSKKCRSSSCRKCKGRHNTLLHLEKISTPNRVQTPESSTQVTLSAYSFDKLVFLSTAVVNVGKSTSLFNRARALLDNGSQVNFISDKLCKELRLKQSSSDICISGINKMSSNLSRKCEVTIAAVHGMSKYTITCYVLPKITDNLPIESINIQDWNIPTNIALADPDFNKSGEIDLLLGADVFWKVIYNQLHKLNKGLPTLRNTAFGWIVCGSLNQPTEKASCNLTRSDPLRDDMRRFWEVEEVNGQEIHNTDNEYCEEHFQANLTRASDGRFVVKIPFKMSPELLGNSKKYALNRLIKLEKKLERTPNLKIQYTDFLQEYVDLGHMSLVTEGDDSLSSFFLPHHAVLKEDSTTTKLRVVFDGSATSDTGLSLNDVQHTGPAIVNDLFQILLRIRQYNFVVVADVAKMYRQIWVHPNDRRFQKILWRFRPDEKPQAYELNTVTYGTSSAPFLAIRCLQQAAYENQDMFPEASQVILNDFYVDDLITGFSSEQEAIKICSQVANILNKYQFNLRKWHSNSKVITSQLVQEENPGSEPPLSKDSIKALGIHWNSQLDIFTYTSIDVDPSRAVTKRYVLSCISKVFDPLGLLSPCIITTKIMIQKLWSCKADWDDPIPFELYNEWATICKNLQLLRDVTIPRQVLLQNHDSIDIIGFCDASQEAYACCIYVRSSDEANNIKIELLCSKTRVAPLKVLTIPRLELLSAVLLAELMSRVSKTLTVRHKLCYWSDSQIVLAWLKKDPKSLQTFVSNRVAKIQERTDPNKWYHVTSAANPADIASRGSSVQTLSTSQLWWHGPPFLSLPQNKWPSFSSCDLPHNVPEIKKAYTSLVNTKHETLSFHKYSSYNRLKRTIAYCIRFVNNLRLPKATRKLGFLTTIELQNATHMLVKWAQAETFAHEIQVIKTKTNSNLKCKLSSLSPFLDEFGLLRVGGRLSNSDQSYTINHPLILNGKHWLTKLILEEEHKGLLHAGPHQLLSHVRQQFWPTSGLQAAKRVIRHCIRCFRFNPKVQFPIMGNLPKERVTVSHAFNNTGVDLAGPFSIKDRKGRGSKLHKAWICLFICLSTKAMHIELITSLSTDAFLACFRRFISRRGKPTKIWSDNGTNLVGTNNQLKQFFKSCNSEIANACARNSVQWNFIPPHAPHFGGLWEAGIKSIKRHLYKVIAGTILTFEEFITVLAQIEATLNSRPLTPLSTDPNDLSPLTPAHFLIGRSLMGLPEVELLHIPINRLNRFQLLQQLHQSFWSRWSKEYLHLLQQRGKWRFSSLTTPIGTLVLIKEDHLPPCNWMLARIVDIHPGSDGITRVVTLRTTKGMLKRPVAKICPLPIEEDTTIAEEGVSC